MPFTEAGNAAVTRTELDSVFSQAFEYADTFPGQATANDAELFIPINTDHSGYFYEVYMGVGFYQNTGETQNVATSTPQVTNKTFVAVADFTNGVYLSKDLFDDNMHGVWAATVADMARMARVTQDKNAFQIFRGAFTTTLTPDGNALCSTHTLIQGTTTTNTYSGATSALSDTSLNTAIIALRQQPNQRGITLGGVPSILLVPSALFKLAIQLTDSALVSESSNNAINIYRSAYGFKVSTSIWLDSVNGGSDTAWFLLSKNHGIRRLIRQGLETNFRDWSYSDNREYFYQANYREQYFAQDYGGVVGFVGV